MSQKKGNLTQTVKAQLSVAQSLVTTGNPEENSSRSKAWRGDNRGKVSKELTGYKRKLL